MYFINKENFMFKCVIYNPILLIIFLAGTCTSDDTTHGDQFPDLEVTDLNFTTPVVGQPFEVEIEVTNREKCCGVDPVSLTRTGVFLNYRASVNDDWGSTPIATDQGSFDTLFLDTNPFPSIFDCHRDEVIHLNTTITLTNNGQYQIFAKADAFNVVEEASEDNNVLNKVIE